MKHILFICLCFFVTGHLSAQCSPDYIPPFLASKTNITAVLGGPQCMAVLHPQDLLDTFSDNCTQPGSIQLRVRRVGEGFGFPLYPNGAKLSLTLADLPGPILAEVWAKDAAGNTAFTFAAIELTNPAGCSFALLPDTIQAGGIQGLDDVTWGLHVQSPGLPDTVFYQLADQMILPESLFAGAAENNVYTVWPSKDNNPVNGVSTLDLVLIHRDLVGIQPFQHVIQYVAADVDRNNIVTPNDVLELRKLILGIYTEWPDNTSWRFIAGDYNFPLPTNPIAGPIPELVTFDRTRPTPLPDFIAIKVGDVNGTAVFNSLVAVEDRSLTALGLPDMRLERGQTVRVPVTLTDFKSLDGLQGAFSFDPALLEITALHPGVLPDFSAENYYQQQPGVLTFSWANASPTALSEGAPLFFLEITAHASFVLSEALRLHPARLRAEAYDVAGRTADLELRFAPLPFPVLDEVLPAFPNPTTGDFFVPVRLAEAGQVRLEVFDTNGRLVFSIENKLSAGEHQLRVPAEQLGSTGVYAYRVKAGAAREEQGRVVFSQK